ncbi:hypothetical protein FLA_1496 [Filimonas lacunae]|nr:hypothetical protein FLA_1496 [Filimonas lacunae]
MNLGAIPVSAVGASQGVSLGFFMIFLSGIIKLTDTAGTT